MPMLCRFSFLILTGIFICVNAQSQTRGDDPALTADNVSAKESSRDKHSVYIGTGYGSNMIYMGSTMSDGNPFHYASLVYGFNEKLYLSLSSFHLNEINPYLAFSGSGLSYIETVNSWFDYSCNLSGYIIPKTLESTLFHDFIYGSISAGFDWRLLYTVVSLSGIMSEETCGYIQVRNSRYFETHSFLKNKATLSFDPYISFLTGPVAITGETDTLLIHANPAFGPMNMSRQYPEEEYKNILRPIELDIGLPVSFNYDFMTIEGEVMYAVPLITNIDYSAPEGLILLVSLSFKIL